MKEYMNKWLFMYHYMGKIKKISLDDQEYILFKNAPRSRVMVQETMILIAVLLCYFIIGDKSQTNVILTLLMWVVGIIVIMLIEITICSLVLPIEKIKYSQHKKQ